MLYDLKIFQKAYDFLIWTKSAVQRFAKVHKYSLGVQLENETIELIRQITRTNFKRGDKSEFIDECFVRYEIVKVLIRLSMDYKLLTIKQYEFASNELDEIGRLLGGWRRRFS
jgi:hypothetical protein